jgi:methionine-rich copper-binding protein CopC
VTIPAGAVQDLAGNALAEDYTFSFTTEAEPDTVAPTVEATDPADGATDVPVDQAITVTFSEAVEAGNAFDQIALTDAEGVAVEVAKSIADNVLTITPSASLAYNTTYTVTIPAGAVQDLAGNALAEDYTFSFTTEAAPAVFGLSGSLSRDEGLKATVSVTPQQEFTDTAVVVFELLKDGTEPVSIVALEKRTWVPGQVETLIAHFNVTGEEYTVKVFVFDEFTSDTESALTNLAEPLTLS